MLTSVRSACNDFGIHRDKMTCTSTRLPPGWCVDSCFGTPYAVRSAQSNEATSVRQQQGSRSSIGSTKEGDMDALLEHLPVSVRRDRVTDGR